jgi:thymidylate synthase (FAD)
MQELIKDPYFRVEIDHNASSANAAAGIWYGQHVTVAEGFSLDDLLPANPADAVIRHQLKVKHWSVLEDGFVSIHFGGFCHSVVMQLVRHQDSKPLVQSSRYTGKRFIDVAYGRLDIREAFYFRPYGKDYQDRSGNKYHYSEADFADDLDQCSKACQKYADRIESGWAEEHARDFLPQNIRQNFKMSGTIRAVMHWLDQRTLTDSQPEAKTLAYMALDKLKEWQPEFFEFYEKTRAGRNLLAP